MTDPSSRVMRMAQKMRREDTWRQATETEVVA